MSRPVAEKKGIPRRADRTRRLCVCVCVCVYVCVCVKRTEREREGGGNRPTETLSTLKDFHVVVHLSQAIQRRLTSINTMKRACVHFEKPWDLTSVKKDRKRKRIVTWSFFPHPFSFPDSTSSLCHTYVTVIYVTVAYMAAFASFPAEGEKRCGLFQLVGFLCIHCCYGAKCIRFIGSSSKCNVCL
jgi:hypothetical protein